MSFLKLSSILEEFVKCKDSFLMLIELLVADALVQVADEVFGVVKKVLVEVLDGIFKPFHFISS